MLLDNETREIYRGYILLEKWYEITHFDYRRLDDVLDSQEWK